MVQEGCGALEDLVQVDSVVVVMGTVEVGREVCVLIVVDKLP